MYGASDWWTLDLAAPVSRGGNLWPKRPVMIMCAARRACHRIPTREERIRAVQLDPPLPNLGIIESFWSISLKDISSRSDTRPAATTYTRRNPGHMARGQVKPRTYGKSQDKPRHTVRDQTKRRKYSLRPGKKSGIRSEVSSNLEHTALD